MAEEANHLISTKSVIKGSAILITALAWNTAIKELVDMGFRRYAVLSRVIYVAIVTILSIVIILLFNYFVIKKTTFISK